MADRVHNCMQSLLRIWLLSMPLQISLAYILLFLIAWSWSSLPVSSELQVFYGHTGAVRCGQFTPDGKAVVTGGGEGDATLKVWDPKSGSCTGTIQGHGFHEAGAIWNSLP